MRKKISILTIAWMVSCVLITVGVIVIYKNCISKSDIAIQYAKYESIVSTVTIEFPRRVNLTYNGIKYKIGDLQQQEQIKMTINGCYYKRIFANDLFKGSININNENYPILNLLVGDEQQMLGYRDYQDGGRLHTYGEAFIGEDFNDITICIENEKSGWNSMDGFMLSAPAKNRVEALEVSNKLMNNVLKRKLK